jgi:REP element-mobilizing transposase RayT
MDRSLDTTHEGPRRLNRKDVAEIIATEICCGIGYDLDAWVIMSNQVHLLIRPLAEPIEIMRRLKGRTARAANMLIRQTGRPFWQAESWDRWMRSGEEISRVIRYIHYNPVVAGLVSRPEDYKWSSAWVGRATGAEAPAAG